MLIMYRLRQLPTRINNRQEAKYFILVSLGLSQSEDDPDVLNRVKALLLDPDLAYKLRDNMAEFYLGLTPDYLGVLYLESYRESGLTLFEFKYQVLWDILTMPLDAWVGHQIARLEIIDSWDLI